MQSTFLTRLYWSSPIRSAEDGVAVDVSSEIVFFSVVVLATVAF